MRLIIVATAAVLFGGSVAGAQSSIDNAHKFAWGENIGWTNWRDANSAADGVIVGTDFLSGSIWGENVGWINVGDGTPVNGTNYANVNGTDFGVNIDVNDDLFGFAWGENIGWINFDTRSRAPNQARFDFTAGRFRGYAWGENVGWINLDDPTSFVATPPPPTIGDDTCVGGGNNGQPCAQHSDCPGGFCQLKNRFITAQIPVAATAHGLKVRLVSIDGNSVATPSNYNGTDRWAGAPSLSVSDGTSPSFNAARLQCAFTSQNWSAVGRLHVYGDVVVPASAYDASVCQSATGPCSPPLRLTTAKWGDIVAPITVVNFQDIVSVVTKFQGVQPPPQAPSKTRTKLNEPVNPGPLVNFQDIAANVAAFQGVLYKNKFPTPPATCL